MIFFKQRAFGQMDESVSVLTEEELAVLPQKGCSVQISTAHKQPLLGFGLHLSRKNTSLLVIIQGSLRHLLYIESVFPTGKLKYCT